MKEVFRYIENIQRCRSRSELSLFIYGSSVPLAGIFLKVARNTADTRSWKRKSAADKRDNVPLQFDVTVG